MYGAPLHYHRSVLPSPQSSWRLDRQDVRDLNHCPHGPQTPAPLIIEGCGLRSSDSYKHPLAGHKSNPITGLVGPRGLQEVESPRFHDNRYINVVRLSALLTGRLVLISVRR
jgi:hypothetical protein